MSIRIRSRAPRTRCHRCGSPEIAALCHHCGRPLCQRHRSGTIITSEFAGLGFQKAEPQHCDEHRHVVKPPIRKYAFVGGGVAALGFLLMFASVAVGLVLLLAGLAAGALIWWEDHRRAVAAFENRPKLPVVPSIDSVKVREIVQGRLTLDERGAYHSSVTPVEGGITLDMTFGRPDQDRLRDYRTKFRLDPAQDVEFSAGYAVLLGRAGLEFTDRTFTPPVLPLTGLVHQHPFLATPESRAGAKWQLELTHRLTSELEVDAFPLWLTPALVPESDQRALQLDLQWLGNWPSEEASLEADKVERLRLYVPASWGNVEYVSESATIGGQADPVTGGRLIEWKQLPLGARADHRLTLSVRFEDRIRLTDVITGSLKVSFKGALSGLAGVEVYHPMGGRRSGRGDSEVKTEVTADISLSLSGVRYQDVRVVPDQKKDDLLARPESHEYPGVIPDHETLIALTNAMSDSDYYVKWVIGHAPRNGDRANALNRAWDIGGRLYEGVYPVDFYVGLTGEEVYGGDIHAEAGNSKVRLSVKGAFASDEMEERIESVWYGLHDIVGETLKARTRAEPPGRNHQRGYRPPKGAEPADDDRAKALLDLRRRRKDFQQAVAQGRISEELFRQFDAEIEREMAELNRADGPWDGEN
ncbi:hypothetical protein SAMN05421837_110253 [Amycolatopsis pretoriensis]|uniref:Uncharacterized protein n=1 Tax=Amycolatopsis pretoriensis TaxID=218821 RepID=A0A1H5RFN9_9PSEU|nr:hypothetical protein [Amycolatopsis pretoriensis]SEF36498.1 hypothetical protein SAMN05421837_110253 [Amycolatopsis pretoriensis]